MMMDLTAARGMVAKQKTQAGLHYVDGEWVNVRKVNGRWTIQVCCPRCHKEGRLTRYVRRGGVRRYIIFHDNFCCQFSRSDPAYAHLDRVYRAINEGSG